MKLATDIGGTFTDLVSLDESTGAIGLAKASSTPQGFAKGILDTVDKSGLNPADVDYFVHGTTVIINALTERNGAKTALVTTKGFRDVLAITRCNRPDMYNLRFTKQPPFIPRELRLEVDERLNYKGEVLTPLDEDSVRAVAEELKKESVEAVAVCLLHSYANPSHEQRCAQILADELPNVFITQSNEITKEWREFERTSTTALNSYVRPVASRYLSHLEEDLVGRGIRSPLNTMKSNGGTASFRTSKAQPIHMVESGPVGGVIGAQAIGHAIGEKNLITLDIGGTTAKTSLIEAGEVRITTEYKIEYDKFRAGYPIKVPVVDIVEIGAGGGSIGWIDNAGALQVGPKSAGAVPGPACYGLGGTQPTVTDANVVAGRINPEYFLGGDLKIDPEKSRAAMQPLADHFKVSIEEAALGIIRLANANMVNAIKLVSVRKGHDPRDYVLVAFGGGGSMHAAALAKELGIPRVLIPFAPSNFSAWGMLMTDPKQDFIQTLVLLSEEAALGRVDDIFKQLGREAVAFFLEEGFSRDNIQLARYADMRYMGQEHTVRVPIMADNLNCAEIEERFHQLHERAYTFRLDSPVQYVNFHITATAPVAKPDLYAFAPKPTGKPALKGKRMVDYDEDGWLESLIYERENLQAGEKVRGPAIVEEPSATTVIYRGQQAGLDELGNIIIETEV